MTDKNIHFHPITEDDAEFLYRVYASTREDEMKTVPWGEEEKEQFLRFQFNAQHTFYMEQFAQAEFQIILKKNQPIGRLYIDRRKDEIRLIDIALLPEYRGQGIGVRLMQDILNEAQKVNKLVRIHVEKNNPAIHLYRRLGFKQLEDQGVYFLMEWTPEPAAVHS